MAAPTQRDLFLVGRNEAVSGRTRFNRAIIDTDGSDVNVCINVAATQAEEVVAFHQTAQNAKFLATSFGEDLDRLVWDLYRIRRKEEAPAVVTVVLTRAGGGVGFPIPQGSPFATTTGQVFVSVAPAAIAAGSNGPVSIICVADVAGEGGNVDAGLITVIQAGFPDNSVVCTNPAPAAGGAPRQSDDEFKVVARQFFVNARRGTKSAIEFGAVQVPQVAQATATEVLDADAGIPIYRANLIVSDLKGQANSAVAALVETELDEYRGLGVPVAVIPASPQYVNVRIEGVAFLAGTNTTQALADAKRRVASYINNLRPGATLRVSALLAAIGPEQVPGLVVPSGALKEPAADLIPVTGTVIRTTADRVEILP